MCSSRFTRGQEDDPALAADKIPAGSKLFIEPMDGFDNSLSAAIMRKDVPVKVVDAKEKAEYILSGTLPRRKQVGPATSTWQVVTDSDREMFRKNAYRVLLTRARQGTVLFVPEGDELAGSRQPSELNEIAAFLVAAGANT